MTENVDLARLVVAFEAQADRYLRDLKKQREETQKWRRKVTGNVSAVSKAFKGLASAAAVGLLTRQIIRNTATQERALAQLRQGWESTGGTVGRSVDQIVADARRLQNVTIFGDEQIIQAQALLITFTGIMESQLDRATRAALDLSTRMDQDLRSSVVQIGKALNDPVANLGALGRSGIQFSESQKDLIKYLAGSNRLMQAQDIILVELERQFGGSAQAARETFGGSLQGLTNAFGDLLEGNGRGGLNDARMAVEQLTAILQDPATAQGITAFVGAAITSFSTLLEIISKTVTGIQDVAREIARLATGGPKLLAQQREDIKAEMAQALRNLETAFDPTSQDREIERLRRLNAELAEVEGTMRALGQLDEPVATMQRGESSGAPTSPGVTAAPVDIEKTLQGFLDKDLERDADLQSDIESMTQSLMTEEETIRASYARRQEIIDEALARRLLSEQEANDLLQRAKEEHDDWFLEKEQDLAKARMDVAMSIADFGIALAKQDSKAERALLAIKAAVAIRAAMMNMQVAMSEALATPWPANLAAIAQVASIGTGIISNLKGIDTSVPSFEGGGDTGAGARIGGIDGKGGFPAILHPNERVLDMTRGGGGVTVNQSFDIDARGADPAAAARIQQALDETRERTKAEIIQMKSEGKL